MQLSRLWVFLSVLSTSSCPTPPLASFRGRCDSLPLFPRVARTSNLLPPPSFLPSATAAAALAASAAAAFRAPIAPEQIHIAYTSAGGSALSVDFVGGAAAGAVHWGASPSALTHSANSSSFNFSTIGWMHQALMDFAGVVPAGARGYYAVEAGGNASAVFAVTPLVANRSERHVVFGDFGLRDDESMRSLIADAAAGEFDSVLHVGDWACE